MKNGKRYMLKQLIVTGAVVAFVGAAFAMTPNFLAPNDAQTAAWQPERGQESSQTSPGAPEKRQTAVLQGASQPTSAPSESPPLTADEQKRYDAVALALLRALEKEDKVAYRALHTDAAWNDAIDWWRDLFAAQRASFGPIVRGYPCARGLIRFGKLGYRSELANGAICVVRFEDKVGGAFSFELDKDGKIARTSVFIKEELAQYDPKDVKPIYER